MAREVGGGVVVDLFLDVLRHLTRCSDVDLARAADIPALRAFFQQWIADLDLGEH